MNGDCLFAKVIHRAIAAGVNTAHLDEVVIFLAKEIEQYRDKIDGMQTALNEKCDKINELKKRLSSIYGERAETFTEERESDGGTMTLNATTANWKIAANVLLHNGYFVCCHFDDKLDADENVTITIEYWRA